MLLLFVFDEIEKENDRQVRSTSTIEKTIEYLGIDCYNIRWVEKPRRVRNETTGY